MNIVQVRVPMDFAASAVFEGYRQFVDAFKERPRHAVVAVDAVTEDAREALRALDIDLYVLPPGVVQNFDSAWAMFSNEKTLWSPGA